jgi:hypothetical protein
VVGRDRRARQRLRDPPARSRAHAPAPAGPRTSSEDCYQLLLIKKISRAMPDLAPEKLDGRSTTRSSGAATTPRRTRATSGIRWERMLVAQGYVLDSIREDPAIRVAALARLWVDRASGPEGLQRSLRGRARALRRPVRRRDRDLVVFLRGAKFKNDLNPRTFEEVEAELRSSARDPLRRGLPAPRARALGGRRHARGGGALGWVGAGSERVPARDPRRGPRGAREAGTRGRGSRPAVSLDGPVRLATGVGAPVDRRATAASDVGYDVGARAPRAAQAVPRRGPAAREPGDGVRMTDGAPGC